IMENHLHLIASGNNLAREIGHFKSFTARKIIDYLRENNINAILKQLQFHKLKHKKGRTYQLWQEGSHPKVIQGEKMMIQKMEYMHCNPVKRGYVDDPTHWRYSSARNYAEQESLLEVCTEW
ncbi:MAG: transposase, partial [Planctomycetota bacterium]